jgi:stage II sporulation protein P
MTEVAAPVLNPFNLLGASEQERLDGGYYALVDEQGNVLDLTALRVYKDDEFISADNRRYRVTKVVNDTAQCRFIGTEVIAYEEYEEPFLSQNGTGSAAGTEAAVPAVANKPVVGIYHTHGDESYRPSQGYSSAPAGQKGGIAQVAETLKGELEKQGITALYNDATHSPHDSGAYHRSRRTATTLMKQGAQVLIDVHRDAVPASAYRTQINGQNVSQVKLVVGKRNPASSASLNYAKKVKGFLDKHYPGLAKGIFIGKGVYNQDLRSTNLLVEVGTDKITLEEAKRGATLLANTLPNIIGG